MKYRYFYADYSEGKEIPSGDAWEANLDQILHSMNCVLHVPNNFFGIVNSKEQTLQFMVEKDRTVTIDIPILEQGKYLGSKQENNSLNYCLEMVKNLSPDEDFLRLVNSSLVNVEPPKPWWRFW